MADEKKDAPETPPPVTLNTSGAKIGVGEQGDGNQDAVDPHPDYVVKNAETPAVAPEAP